MESKMLRAGGCIQTSVLISTEFYRMCKQHGIKFSEALRVGISLMLADLGVKEYDTRLNLHRKMTQFREKLEVATQELNELKEKYEKK